MDNQQFKLIEKLLVEEKKEKKKRKKNRRGNISKAQEIQKYK